MPSLNCSFCLYKICDDYWAYSIEYPVATNTVRLVIIEVKDVVPFLKHYTSNASDLLITSDQILPLQLLIQEIPMNELCADFLFG